MKKANKYVGIDISMDYFNVSVFDGVRHEQHQFPNEPEGFKSLLKKTGIDTWFIMEASGPYYLPIACFLYEQGLMVSVVNPLVIRRYAQMRLLRAKTDKKDAATIAEYAESQKPTLWQPDKVYMVELRQLYALYEQLTKQRTALANQLHAFTKSKVGELAKGHTHKGIANLDQQLMAIVADMELLIKTHHNEQLSHLTSIPGIGKKTAMLLIVITGGFTKFESAKQLSSYIGISPRIYDSGTSVKGKRKICKMGMARIRAMLYMCSWSAVKYNKTCKALYERLLSKGKPAQVALIAVVNKLIKQALRIAKKGEAYNQNYTPKFVF